MKSAAVWHQLRAHWPHHVAAGDEVGGSGGDDLAVVVVGHEDRGDVPAVATGGFVIQREKVFEEVLAPVKKERRPVGVPYLGDPLGVGSHKHPADRATLPVSGSERGIEVFDCGDCRNGGDENEPEEGAKQKRRLNHAELLSQPWSEPRPGQPRVRSS